jgi:3-oxoacid CoA-transferase subunit B
VFDFTDQGMVLIETMDGVSVDEVIAKTEAKFTVSPELSEVN